MRTPFFGPFSVSRSLNLSDNRLINLYPAIVDTKSGKDIGAFYNTPGLDALAALGVGPIRAMLPVKDVLYVVSGPQLYSVDTLFNAVLVGSIVGGGHTYSPSAGLHAIALPYGAPPAGGEVTMIDDNVHVGVFDGISAAQQDGFSVINQPGTYVWWQSSLLDMTNFPGVNFASASGTPDEILRIRQIHRQMFLIKQTDVEIWVNVGIPDFTFQRLDGVFVEAGVAAAGSVVELGETLIWLARNHQGQGVVIQMVGYAPKRISTHSIETAIAKWPDMSDATAFSYQQSGHQYYVLSSTSGNETWVYDAQESELAGTHMWHQIAAFSAGTFSRHWGSAHAFFAGRNVIGDYRNGNLYALNPDTLTDAGQQRKWLRSWRPLAKPSMVPVRLPALQIDMQTGIGVPDGADPQCMLRLSHDGGHTWAFERIAAVGKLGETARRVKFNRLGSTRRNAGLDPVFELSSSDAFPAALIGAEFLEGG